MLLSRLHCSFYHSQLCRYYSTYFLKVNGRLRKRSRDCSCCGHFYQYIEQGKICTRYCAGRGRESEELPPLIRLPFNWGDECPEEIFLGDKKTPVPDKLKSLRVHYCFSFLKFSSYRECEDLMEDYYDEETEELENHQGKSSKHSNMNNMKNWITFMWNCINVKCVKCIHCLGDRVVKPQQPTRTTTTVNIFKKTTAKLQETSRTTTPTPTRAPNRTVNACSAPFCIATSGQCCRLVETNRGIICPDSCWDAGQSILILSPRETFIFTFSRTKLSLTVMTRRGDDSSLFVNFLFWKIFLLWFYFFSYNFMIICHFCKYQLNFCQVSCNNFTL